MTGARRLREHLATKGKLGILKTKLAFKRVLRATNTLNTLDRVRLVSRWFSCRQANREFRSVYPEFRIPPASVSYDAYGHVHAEAYYRTGREIASFIANLLEKHGPQEDASGAILDWGCGAARVARHLPKLVPADTQVFGTDANRVAIDWSRKNIHGVEFSTNCSSPPLTYGDASFSCIYGISVFTHLSAASHLLWRDELVRVLRPGGILIVTMNGQYYADRELSQAEQHRFDRGECVIHGDIKEGKKWFVAFQSSAYIANDLFADLEIVEHITSPPVAHLRQEVWVVRKR